MTRLCNDEINTHRRWVECWRTPDAMKQYVQKIMNHMGNNDFFNQPGIEFVREAWLAVEFGEARQAQAVRKISDSWPDVELKFVHGFEQFEVAEVMLPGRRRGEEYQEWERTPGARQYPEEEWKFEAQQISIAVAKIAQQKASKGYPPSAGLFLYLNIGSFGVDGIVDRETLIRRETAIAKDRFRSVWALWGHKLYVVWRDGKPA